MVPDRLNANMQLCTLPEGYGTYHCYSAYSKYKESDLARCQDGEIGVLTPFSPCFTCPDGGISCDDHVKEVFTAAGIPKDQNATLGGSHLWDDGQPYCKQLCESNKEGESCSKDEDNGCTVGNMCLRTLL
jgi:hypothetical protein